MKKILVFGASGLVGSRFCKLYKSSFEIIAPTVDEVDILNQNELEKKIAQAGIDTVVNFAAYTNVDEAEKEKGDKDGLVYRLNSLAPKNLAEFCKESNKFLIHFSTSYVFDGKKKDAPYSEEDEINPIGWYSKTKTFADQFLMESNCSCAILRIEMPYRSHYLSKRDLARFFLEQLKEGKEIIAVRDQKITPGFIDDVSDALRKIVDTRTEGVFHVGPTNPTSPYDFAKLIAKEFGLNEGLIQEISFEEYHKSRVAPRSQHSWLDVSKFVKTFGEGILHTNEQNIKTFKEQIDTVG